MRLLFSRVDLVKLFSSTLLGFPHFPLQRLLSMKFCKLSFVLALGCLSAQGYAQNATTAKPSAAAATQPATQATPATAALTTEQEKQANAMKKQTMKSYADVSLTAEQEKKADEIFTKAIKEVIVKRSAAKITPELQKKQAAAVKEARESGKKGKKQADAAFASAGFTDEQIKVYKETQESLNNAKREFAKSLKDEQIQKLPDNMQKMLKRS